jgi:signal transduction histidine kinase
MSFFLAEKFTTPLKKMQSSTALLAAGDYTVKTHIQRRDEIGALAVSIDILSDKLLDARRATENLDRLRRDFIANVSHELRTPVTVLRGSLEALRDGVVTQPAQVENYYRQMLGETLSLQRLVNDLMELARLQNTDFKIDMTALNVYDVLTDALRSARQLAESKHIDIRLEADAQTLAVTGDYGRLKQMFLVILDNAVKFSPENSEIQVTLEKNSVSIRDRGPGIPPEAQPYIFDRFYKTKSADNKTGSGLGLAIAKQIAERHGIDLTLNAQYENGAEFLFVFG